MLWQPKRVCQRLLLRPKWLGVHLRRHGMLTLTLTLILSDQRHHSMPPSCFVCAAASGSLQTAQTSCSVHICTPCVTWITNKIDAQDLM